MPVLIPVVAAAASIGAGVAAMGAATTLLGTIAAGAMIAGGALSLAGAVTGNQKLSKWGSIIGIAGGIGALANGAINAVGTELAAGELAGEAAEQTVSQAAQQTANAAAPAAQQSAGLLGNAAPGLDTAAAGMSGDLAAGISPLSDSVGAAANSSLTAGAPSLATAAPALGDAGGALAGASLAGGQGLTQTAASVASEGGGSMLSNVNQFIKSNKELVDLGGGLLKGAMQSGEKEKEMLAYLREKEAQEQRARASYSASVVGSAGVPFRVNPNAQVQMGAPVNPIRYVTTPQVPPAMQVPAVPGFINNAMQGG